MSWQVATFAGLVLVLVGGFWWYERARPSARLVALVAALAALAVAGRLVLAPIPNVVATTDIALFTGYALGGGPGFAVGALAAPISNIWLGQGPWTAWQMAGWGLVGLGGAWLAVLTRRRLGRLGLALACAVAGLAYGALVDLSVMVTYGGEQSLDRYLALSARGIPFNIAHAAGNFAIALVAGPALVRMISRFRTRLAFTWRPEGALPLLCVAALVAGGALVAAGDDRAAARASGEAWLVRAQGDDGGFAAGRGLPSNPAMTGWAMLGLEASGTNPLDVARRGRTPVSYLRSEIDRLRSVGDLERTILALAAAGIDPRRFGGSHLVADLRRRRDGDGSVDGQVNLTAFYALAMRAAGAEARSLRRSAAWLRGSQNADGGWGIQPQAPSEADSTGAALQALVAAGTRGSAAASGARWLRRAQRSGGGYALGGTGLVNSQSTAWAVQGLAAVGGEQQTIDRAVGYLSRLQAPDGHYRYSASSDQTPIWVTAQVLTAIARRQFPLVAVARAGARSRGAESEPSSGGGGAGGDAGAEASSQGGAPASATGGGEASAPAATPSAGGGSQGGGGGGAPAATGSGSGVGGTPAVSEAEAENAPAAAEPVGAESAGDGEAVPVSVAYQPDSSGSDSTGYLVAVAAALAIVGAAGFVWYRRRAP